MIARCLLTCALSLGLAAADAPTPPPGFSTARPVVTITTSHGVITAELFADQAPETVRTFIELAEARKTSTKGGREDQQHFYDGLTFHRVIPGFMLQGGCPRGDGTGDPGFTFKDEINADSLDLDTEQALADGQLHPQCGYMQEQFIQAVIQPAMAARGITQDTPRAEAEATFQAVLKEADGTTLKAFYEAMGYRYDDSLPASSKPERGVLAMANSGPGTNGSQFFINLADTPHLTGKHTVFGRVVEGMAVVDAIAEVPTAAANRPTEAVVIESIRLSRPASVDELFTPAE